MKNLIKKFLLCFGIVILISITGCNGGGSASPASQTFTIGGNVTGLNSGQSFTISVNNGSKSEPQVISANGQVDLAQDIGSGTDYNVTIPVQPQNEKCSVTNGQGQITDSNVVVQITCSDNTYTLGGTISGLEPGESVTLKDYDQVTNQITLTNNTASTFNNKVFNFSETVPYLGSYNVQVTNQPQNQTCVVNNSMGAVYGNISNLNVKCSKSSYSVSVKYIGDKPTDKNIVLVNNGNTLDKVVVNAINQTGQFTVKVPYGEAYNVTIRNTPSDYTCNFVNQHTGNPVDANSNPVVEVSCSKTSGYTIGGTVSGLASNEGVTIQTNTIFTHPHQIIESNGAFTYPNPFNLDESYNVTISNQPNTQHCTITNESGIISKNVINININCSYVNGQLVPLNPNKFSLSTPVAPYAIAVTHDNKYAYVVDNSNSQVIMFKINSDGTLSSLPQFSIFTYQSPTSIAISSDDKYVYVVGTGIMLPNGVIYIYAINSDGSLTLVQDSYPFIQTGISPFQISLTPDDKYVYVVNGLSTVSMYNVESGGSNLSDMNPSTLNVGHSTQSMIITSDSKYAYVLNGSTISMYSVSSTGILESLTPSTVSTGDNPNGIAITKDNKFVYLANSNDSNIYIYSVGTNGVLTKINQVNNLGVVPYTVTTSPDGNYLYVMNYPDFNNQVYMLTFTINHTTGDLTPSPYMPQQALDIKGSWSTTTNQIVATTTNQSGNNYMYIIGAKNIYMYSIYNQN